MLFRSLLGDGSVVSWGMNDFGQTNVPGDLSTVFAIACGGGHSLAIVGNGPPAFRGLLSPLFTKGIFTLSLPTSCGHVYALEFKVSLGDSTWTALPPLMPGNGRLRSMIDSSGSDLKRFYRVRRW